MKLGEQIRTLFMVGLILSVTFLLPVVLHAEVPHQLSYQGYLTDDLGDPLNGDYLMIFSIYDVPGGGTALWNESQGSVRVTNGIFNVHIGLNPTGNPFPTDLFDGQRWLGVTVGTDDEMVPRQLLTSTPFAKRAEVADRVKDGVIETIHLANDAVTADKIDSGAVSSSHLQDGAAINEIKDDDGAGSGLDADTLDGMQASSFVSTGSDYGRSGVAGNLYEGSMTLTQRYINQSGDDMIGRFTASVTPFDSGWHEAIKGSLLAGGSNVGAGVFGYAEGYNAYGVRGSAVGASGVGVYGEAPNGIGVHGEATGFNGIGVLGETADSGAWAIGGVASYTGDAATYGGFFDAAGGNSKGVYGRATNDGNFTNYGGYFTAAGSTGRGVFGEASGEFGYGVYGETTSSSGTGVFGEAPNNGVHGRAYGSTGDGVYGEATGATGRGVYGRAANTGQVQNYGGYFIARGSWGRGVQGEATGTVGTNHGGFFTAAGPTGRGVYGGASGASGRGVFGQATNTGDVENYGGYFVAQGATGRGVYGEASGANGRGISGIATNTGDVENYGGSFTAHGTYGEGVRARVTGNAGYAVNAIALDGVHSIGVRSQGNSYDFYAAGPGIDYNSSSSIRWKQNIREIEGALEKVLQMRGVYFDWDEEHGGRPDMGFIAEEVGLHVPEVVSFEEDGEYASGLDYSKMTPVLLQAIKEQQGIISELRAEIENLKAEIKAIR